MVSMSSVWTRKVLLLLSTGPYFIGPVEGMNYMYMKHSIETNLLLK